MGILSWFRKAQPIEKRSAMSGFTAELISARESYISGRRGIAELSATAQSCVSLWEHGLSIASVTGTDLLTRRHMAMIARSLALRNQSLLPWEVQQDRRSLSAWIEAQAKLKPSDSGQPTSKQVVPLTALHWPSWNCKSRRGIALQLHQWCGTRRDQRPIGAPDRHTSRAGASAVTR